MESPAPVDPSFGPPPLPEWAALLERTAPLLDAWLRPLPAAWLDADEGPGTWSARGVLGHLLDGERHDWVPRTRHLLAHGEAVAFAPFDRVAWQRRPAPSIGESLDAFAAARADSLRQLAALRLTAVDLDRTGRHPEFGRVTLRQHLATWVAHDQTHVMQIARVLGHRLAGEVGPWRAYLRVARDIDGGGSS
ncbi:MAG: DinB family protein [Planctomycetota bacterium]